MALRPPLVAPGHYGPPRATGHAPNGAFLLHTSGHAVPAARNNEAEEPQDHALPASRRSRRQAKQARQPDDVTQQPRARSPRGLLIPLRYHRERNTVQHGASRRRKNALGMQVSQPPAKPGNARIITRNESRSAVRVRSSALQSRLLYRVGLSRPNNRNKKRFRKQYSRIAMERGNQRGFHIRAGDEPPEGRARHVASTSSPERFRSTGRPRAQGRGPGAGIPT